MALPRTTAANAAGRFRVSDSLVRGSRTAEPAFDLAGLLLARRRQGLLSFVALLHYDTLLSMLKMPRAEYDRIRRHAEETYPHECCGVLLGKMSEETRIVLSAARCQNTQAASDWFNIDPRQIVRIQREAAAVGHDIIGFYHSHPDADARWSASDLREAHWLGCSYVITSLREGTSAETNSFLLAGSSEADKRFQDEPIDLGD